MGADWFCPSLYLGIRLPTAHILKLHDAICAKGGDFPFSLGFLEGSTHSRSEGEETHSWLLRCTGFLGLYIEENTPLEALPGLRAQISNYLDENKDLFAQFRDGEEIVKATPTLQVGELRDAMDVDESVRDEYE